MDRHICCSRELQPRFSNWMRGSSKKREEGRTRISCCNQQTYDTKYQICCGLRVSRQLRNTREFDVTFAFYMLLFAIQDKKKLQSISR